MDAPLASVPDAEVKSIRAEVLDTAKGYVLKDRNQQYDTPERNFEMIAEMWSAYTGHTYRPHDVAVMMIMVKLSRISTSPDVLDHWIDTAGYAACGGETRPSVVFGERQQA